MRQGRGGPERGSRAGRQEQDPPGVDAIRVGQTQPARLGPAAAEREDLFPPPLAVAEVARGDVPQVVTLRNHIQHARTSGRCTRGFPASGGAGQGQASGGAGDGQLDRCLLRAARQVRGCCPAAWRGQRALGPARCRPGGGGRGGVRRPVVMGAARCPADAAQGGDEPEQDRAARSAGPVRAVG